MRPTNTGNISVTASPPWPVLALVAQALLPVFYAWNASALATGRSACATHDLFISAFSGAFGFLSITVKEARTALSGRLRPCSHSWTERGLRM